MRVTILAVGSRGDVQPLVALALGLQSVGYDVGLAAPASFRSFVVERGLTFTPLAFDVDELLTGDVGAEWVGAGRNLGSFVRVMHRIVEDSVDRFLPSLVRACAGAEIVLSTHLGLLAHQVAARAGVPFYLCGLFPFSRTRQFPSVLLPFDLPLRGGYNLLTHLFVEQFLWMPFRGLANRSQARSCGLPPLRRSPYATAHALRVPVLAAFSPAVVPRPRDWGPWVHLTGYWFLDRPETWYPPADLADFLNAGPPPVYVGMGSMVGTDPGGLMDSVVAALGAAGVRGVIVSGWGGLAGAVAGGDVFVTNDVPHDWLFPRVAAAVHHGGAGTTAAVLRAGIPMVTCPFFSDQFFWGARIASLGAGPPPLPRRRITARRLTGVVRLALTRSSYKERAQVLSSTLRAENGVARAVDVLHSQLRLSKVPSPTVPSIPSVSSS